MTVAYLQFWMQQYLDLCQEFLSFQLIPACIGLLVKPQLQHFPTTLSIFSTIIVFTACSSFCSKPISYHFSAIKPLTSFKYLNAGQSVPVKDKIRHSYVCTCKCTCVYHGKFKDLSSLVSAQGHRYNS